MKRFETYKCMNYYIPIHRDNIDNVITLEGIAPMSYYPARGFGYGYFKALKDVPCNNAIILFDKIPKIDDLSAGGVDMVVYIEIESRFLENYPSTATKEGIAITDTISLYPWNCRFLFQSEEALRQAVIMCRTSLCNKFWSYYDFDLIDSSVQKARIELGDLNVNADNHTLERIAREQSANRLKGFLYAYVMGRYVSISQQLAYFLQTERRMYDVATTMTGLQVYDRERYLAQLTELEDLLENYDPNRLELQKKWKDMIERCFEGTSNQQAFETIVKELGGEGIMKANLARRECIFIRQRNWQGNSKYQDWNAYKKELEEYTQHQLMLFRIKKGDTNTNDDFSLGGMNITTNPKYGSFYGNLVSMIIAGTDWLTIENLRIHRLEVASELTRKVRDSIIAAGQEWEGSMTRLYLNDLRQHIASGSIFDITKVSDVALRSLAAFILKGDDYEEMVRFMEYNAQADYRFALGLWGACTGIADMPKTAIQRMHLDPQGEAKIYLATQKLIMLVPEDVQITPHIYQFQKQNRQTSKPNKDISRILTDKSIGLTKGQRIEILAIWDESKGKTDDDFFAKVKKIKGVGNVKLSKLKEALSYTPTHKEIEPTLFEQQDTKPMGQRFGTDAWRYIEPFLPDNAMVKSRVREDLRWYVIHSRRNESNRHLIDGYRKHLEQKAHPTNPRYSWTVEYFGGLDIDRIVAKLEEVYR